MEENQADYIFKVIIVGSSGVGKSALLLRYTDSHFYENNCSTIGVDYKIKTIEVLVNQVPKIVKLQLWDTAGQERFRSLTINYLRGSHAVIMVFSLDDPESFQSIDYWIELLKTHGSNKGFFLIGNKCDLDKGLVTQEMIHKLCEKYTEISFIKASAKTGENINELFAKLAFELANKQARLLEDKKKVLNLEKKEEEGGEKKGGGRKCCGGT
jgi:Ras-related protein Rab-1A